MTLTAVTIGLGALRYVTGDPAQFDEMFRAKYTQNLSLVVSHGVASVLALISGPWQFLEVFRGKFRRLHRGLGYFYLTGVCVGGVTGLPMAITAEGGPLSRVGFTIVAVAWLATSLLALECARRGDFPAHRRWMIRSYALTFGAVLLRLDLCFLRLLGYDFNAIYPYMSWLSWSVSLTVAELIIEGEAHDKKN